MARHPARSMLCFDETPVQLIGEVRQPFPAQPGQRERYDYEYRRNGTVNLSVTFDPRRGWRNVKVTDRRAAVDYAHCMRELVDVHYPDAACILVVQDNLSIHEPGALYEAFAPAEARRILRRLEFHFTPKHASWLNMVECEISVLQRQCLGRRIDDQKGFKTRSQHGNGGETKPEPASNGCSQPTKPATNSAALIEPLPKSQNHCDEPLDVLLLEDGPMQAVVCKTDADELVGALSKFQGLAPPIDCLVQGVPYSALVEKSIGQSCSVFVSRAIT